MLKTELFKQDIDKKEYLPSEDEQKKASFIKKRLTAMQQARTVVDRDRDTYQTMMEAVFEPYPDERSSSTVPLASSIIELFVADAIKIPTEYRFRGETSKHQVNAKALEYVWKFDWRKNNRKKVFNENEYITAWFWTSVIYTWYEAYNKSQLDFDIGDDMNYTWKKSIFKKANIIVKNVDIRDFYIDNQAIDWIEDASDCIWRQWMSWEKFQNYKNSPLYKNIDKVNPKQYSTEYQSFATEEETTRNGDFVEILHYWNVERDIYTEMANGIIVREHPMITTIDWEKALPFVIRVLGKKNYSIYGRWLCEALMMFNSEVNNLREMLMDWIRRSNSQVLMLWNWLQFNGREFSYDNEILTFDWNMANNFHQVSGNPPNQAIFNYIEQLYKDIAIYVGIDIQNIIWQAQQTAFQTEVQREASQKRINVWIMNRDLAFERFANLYKDLLQTYFPKKDADWIYPQIEVEWEELIGEWEKQRFRKKKWHSMFEVTPEILRWDIMIDTYTNVNAPTISAVERQLKMEFMNSIWTMAQWYALAKQSGIDVDKVLPMNDNLRDLAAEFNLQPQDRDDNEDVKAAKAELRAQLQGMLEKQQWSAPMPPEWQQGWQPQQAWPQLAPQSVPTLPNNLWQWQNI
jgi:hypothetical protein